MRRVIDFRPRPNPVITEARRINGGPFNGDMHGKVDGIMRKLRPHEVAAVDEAARVRLYAAQIAGPVEFEMILMDIEAGPKREAVRKLLTPMLSFEMPAEVVH